jgi:hypothetical protein
VKRWDPAIAYLGSGEYAPDMEESASGEYVRHAAARMLRTLARDLEAVEVAMLKASAARAALPGGSSRAKVTTANARWSTKCEQRDRCEARIEAAGVDMSVAREVACG